MRGRVDGDHGQRQGLCVRYLDHLEAGAGEKFLGYDHRAEGAAQIGCNVLLDQAQPDRRVGQQGTEAGGLAAGNIIVKKGGIFFGKTEIFIPDL